MCAPKDDDEYVVPDYIFVHKDYSFSNPIKPLLMVETKNPVIITITKITIIINFFHQFKSPLFIIFKLEKFFDKIHRFHTKFIR